MKADVRAETPICTFIVALFLIAKLKVMPVPVGGRGGVGRSSARRVSLGGKGGPAADTSSGVDQLENLCRAKDATNESVLCASVYFQLVPVVPSR